MKKDETIVLTGGNFPPVVRIFFDMAPADFKIPSVLCALVFLSVLCPRLRVKYKFDADLHAILLQAIVIANSSDGKSFNRSIHKLILKPLLERDEEMRRKEQAYADLKNSKSKNKDLPPEPLTDVRCVQRITLNKIIKRADVIVRKWGEPLPLAFYCEELSALSEGNRSAYGDLRTLGRIAFDLGSDISSDTCYSGSYNARVDLIWCSVFNGTRDAVDLYLGKKGLMGGNAQRTIPIPLNVEIGGDAPVFKPYTQEQLDLLGQTTTELMNRTYAADGVSLCPTHEVDMSWIFRDVENWCKLQRVEIAKTGSQALDCFYKRSSVIAFRLATLAYYLWNEDPGKRKHIKKLYYYFADYILTNQLALWGRKYEQYLAESSSEEPKKPTLYDQIPRQFTREQLSEMIKKLELTTPTRVYICLWTKRGLIHKVENADAEIFEKNYD